MRKINTGDVFKLARIIKATGAKEEIFNIYSESRKLKEELETEVSQESATEKTEAVQEKIGIKIFFVIFDNCSDEKVEKLVYKLIGGIAEMKETEIEKMPLDEMMKLLGDIVKENNIANFFDSASKLVEQMPN